MSRRSPLSKRGLSTRQRTRLARLERLETRLCLASDWRNPIDASDVDGDCQVSPIDALHVINELNDTGARRLPVPRVREVPLFVDVDGDEFVAPLDALLVINAINSGVHTPYVLDESRPGPAMLSIAIGLGQEQGSRFYSFALDASIAAPESPAGDGDRLELFLVDPADPERELINGGITGMPIFALDDQGATFPPELVQFNASTVRLDLTSLASLSGGELRFRLVDRDGETRSRVGVRPLANDVGDQVLVQSFPLLRGNGSQTIQITADWVSGIGGYEELGIIAFDDASRTVDGVAPDQPGYPQAIRDSLGRKSLFTGHDTVSARKTLDFPADASLGIYAFAGNTGNAPSEDYLRIRSVAPNVWEIDWENSNWHCSELADGGDEVFNDARIRVETSIISPPLELASIGDRLADELSLLQFQLTTMGGVGTIQYEMVQGPNGASVDSTSGQFTWTPTEGQGPGVLPVTIRVSDGTLTDEETFTITVREVNEPPVLAIIGDRTIDEGSSLTFTASATDADLPANNLTYTLIDGPEGTTLDAQSGAFRWTPGESQGPGVFPVTIRASDGTLTDEETFTITVREVNEPPVLAIIGDRTIDEGSSLTFTASATDADLPANNLTYTLIDGPEGATLDTQSGAFRWTPSEAQVPGVFPVTIRASDGTLADEETFTINVANCPFPVDLEGHTAREFGGTANPGSVVAQNCAAIMTEGDSFLVTLESTLLVPVGPSVLRFAYADLNFGTSDSESIRDAFEVAVLDADRRPVTFTTSPSTMDHDDLFNVSEGGVPRIAQNTSSNNNIVSTDLSHLPAGTSVTVVFRLISNDADTTSSVRITDVSIDAGTAQTPAPAANGLPPAPRTYAPRAFRGPPITTGVTTPFPLSVTAPASEFTQLSTALITGQAPLAVRSITANGLPVDAIDATGRFFATVAISPGVNRIEVRATDSDGLSVSAELTLIGFEAISGQLDDGDLTDVTAAVTTLYGRTSFDDDTSVLFTDLSLRNDGPTALRGPLLVGVERFSSVSVTARQSDGRTELGLPFYNYSDWIMESGLPPGGSTESRTISFRVPDRRPFDHDLVVLSRTNGSPAFTSAPIVEAIVDRAYSYRARAADPDGDPLAYALITGPANAAIDAQSGVLSWNPGTADVGTHHVTVRINDGHGGVIDQHFVLSVIQPPPNRPPIILSVPETEAIVGTRYVYDVDAFDPDGEPLQFELVAGPDAMSIGETTGIVTWTPSSNQLGLHPVTIAVVDETGSTTQQSYLARVAPLRGNHDPVILSNPVTSVVPGSPYTYDVDAIDPDGDALAYSLRDEPNGMSIDAASGLITWTMPRSLSHLVFDGVDDFVEIPSSSSLRIPDQITIEFRARRTRLDQVDVILEKGGDWVDLQTNYGIALHSGNNHMFYFYFAGGWRGTSGVSDDEWHNYAIVAKHGDANPRFFIDGIERSVEFGDGVPTINLNTSDASLYIGAQRAIGFPPLHGAAAIDDVHIWNTLRTPAEIAASDVTNLRGNEPGLVALHRFDSGTGQFARDSSELRNHGSLGGGQVENSPQWILDDNALVGDRLVTVAVDDGRGGVAVQSFEIATTGNSNPTFATSPVTGVKLSIEDEPGLVGYWPYESNGTDFSGWNRNLAISRDADFVQGVVGEAGSFPSAFGVRPRDDDELDFNGRSFSFQVWVKTEPGDESFLIPAGKHQGGFANGYFIFVNGHNFTVFQAEKAGLFQARNTDVFSKAVVNDGKWHQIVGTQDDAVVRLFVDGVLDTEQMATPVINSPFPFSVGGINAGPGYVGLVDEVALWDRILTDDEIAALYNKGSGRSLLPPYVYRARAADDDGDPLTYSIVKGPSGLTINPDSGDLSWIPHLTQLGRNDVIIRVEDPFGGSDEQAFVVEVTDAPLSEIAGTVYHDLDVNREFDRGMLLVASQFQDAVLAFDGRTGDQFRDLGFVGTGSGGLDGAAGLAFGPDGHLYVAGSDSRNVIRYDGATGAFIDLFAVDDVLEMPQDIAFGPDGSLYVADEMADAIFRFDGATGAFLATFVAPGSGGLDGPRGMEWGPDGNLYVVSSVTEKILRFDGDDGRFRDEFITSQLDDPFDLKFGPNGGLYVSDITRVLEFDEDTGSLVRVFADSLASPTGLAFGPDGHLYVGVLDQVLRFRGDTGEFLNIAAVETRIIVPNGLVVVPTFLIFAPQTEPGLESRVVYLDQNQNATREENESFATTNYNGDYFFANLPVDDYFVREDLPDGWQSVIPGGTRTVELGPGEAIPGVDLGDIDVRSSTVPVMVTDPPTRASVGIAFRYNASAFDPVGGGLRFALGAKPDGMIIDPKSGVIVWEPTAGQIGQHEIVLTVTDTLNQTIVQRFQIEVADPNTPPVITSTPAQVAVVDLPWRYAIRAQDADGNALTYQLVAAPPGVTVSAAGVVDWTPGSAELGSHFIQFIVDDGHGGQATQSFDLEVVASAPNDTPIIRSTPPRSVLLGREYLYRVDAADPNGDPLAITLGVFPEGMTIDDSGRIQWHPNESQVGSHAATIRVNDGRGGEVTQQFNISVLSQFDNQHPTITSTPDFTGVVGQPYEYNVVAEDPDGDPLSAILLSAPAGMSLDPQQFTIRWTPAADQVGTHLVSVKTLDLFGNSFTQNYLLRVRSVNLPPVIRSVPPTRAYVDEAYIYAVRAIDLDNVIPVEGGITIIVGGGPPLRYSLAAAPNGMTIDSASGVIRWTPTADQVVEPQRVVITVEDSDQATVEQAFFIHVSLEGSNSAPVITSSPPFFGAAVDTPYTWADKKLPRFANLS